jgi:dihydroorotate dehydrogenase (fumarate)
VDLRTRYLGMTLKNPIVPAASPLSWTLDGIRRLEEAGAGAVVMHSLFEEQITRVSPYLDHFLTYGREGSAEVPDYFPDLASFETGPDAYLELLNKAKQAVEIPIIASLNGVSTGGWVGYARLMEEAGADALELNIFYLPTNPRLSGAEVEQMYLDVVRDIKREVALPVAVKLSPYFSSVSSMAMQMAEARADGLVLFNRFYQPDIDLERLEVTPKLTLSQSNELRLPLTWTAILYGRTPLDLAISTGVHTYEDVLKGLLAGAKVTQMASELLQHGPVRIGEILADVGRWMERKEFVSVMQMQGSMSQLSVMEPAAFERANYVKTLQAYRVHR